MLGKASEIKVMTVYPLFHENPEWDAKKPADQPRYLAMTIDSVINESLKTLGDTEIIKIQYQMCGVAEETTESALIIYKVPSDVF